MADPTPRDVPAGNIARLREEVRRLMGLQGSVLDTAITMRRAQDLGILDANGHFIRVGGPPGGSGSPGPPGPPAPGITPDLTPPPTVTNLTAVAGLSQVIAMWDAALYTQGHGHLQTNIYAATRNPGDPQATFSDATLRYSATGALTIASLPSEPNIRWHLWAKWKTVDGVESINPAGGANGVVVTTGQDVSHLLAVLTNQITTSQLYSALNTRIDLIDAPAGTAGSVNARIATETTARSAADTALSNTITTLSATVSNNYTTLNSAITTEASTRASADTTNATNITTLSSRVDGVQAAASFEPYVLWDFTNTLDGWTGSGGLFTPAAEWAQFVSTSTDPVLFSPAVSFPGLRYDKVRARVKRTAGSAWQGTCFYGNAGHGMSASFNKSIPDTTQLNQWVVLEWDMTLLDVGGTDWVDGVTNQIRLDFGTSSADTFLVDWVAIGRRSTGVASTVVAAIQATQSTQATQISSNATAITTVQSNLTAGDTALAAQVTTEATTRANVDGYLGAQYTVRVATTQGGRTVQGGFGISSTSAPGAGGTITMGVLANQFYIAAPSGSAPGVTDVLPFVVQTTDQVVNGVTVPKGVYMDAAYINNLTAMYARFGTLVADSIAAGSINAAHLTLGDGSIGGNLKSTNYVAGTSGWLLQPNGSAEFAAASIRGQLTASQIAAWDLTATRAHLATASINSALIEDLAVTNQKISGDIQSDNFVAGSVGWRVQKSTGAAEFAAATIRGQLTTGQLQVGAFTGNANAQNITVTPSMASGKLNGIQSIDLITLSNRATLSSVIDVTVSGYADLLFKSGFSGAPAGNYDVVYQAYFDVRRSFTPSFPLVVGYIYSAKSEYCDGSDHKGISINMAHSLPVFGNPGESVTLAMHFVELEVRPRPIVGGAAINAINSAQHILSVSICERKV